MAELLTKKVVLISGFRIFPNSTGGHIRTGSFARALARSGHRVLIYSLAGRKEDYRNPDAGRDGRRVDQVEQNLTEETNLGLGFGLLQGAGRRLGLPRVWQYALVRAGVVPARLRAALADADVVISDMPWVAQIAAIAGRKPWFLLSHNLEHRLLEQGTASHRLAAGWMRRIEAAAPRHFRDILACAEEDRDFFRAHDDGSGFGPNLEALEMLKAFCSAERAFLESARIRVLILGSMSPRAYRDGALIATGRVPEVVPYFAAGDAGLNPVMRGSGANVKIFEYLAARLPVISTTFGVRGTELTAGRDFLVYEGGAGLKTALESFVASRSPEQWRAHAEDVWQRHRRSCNMEDIVREALARLPEFGAATV